MLHFVFILAGLAAAIHAFTYGRWLKRQGNLAGAIFSFAVAAAAVSLPVLHMFLLKR